MTSNLSLQLDNVSVHKRGKAILKNVSLNLAPSGFTLVMGPNGAGKSTLLRLMHGLERPHKGQNDRSVSDHSSTKEQSFVFQTPVMMRRTVADNIAYPLTLRGMSAANARNMVKQWAEDVGLDAVKNLEAHNLSGGEQQKLAIARALITEPQILFLDEPTTNLDGRSTREIEVILQAAFANGTRIIMTTHDIGQAKRLANDVIFLNNGEVCEHSTASDFFNAPISQSAQAYLKGEIVE